MTTVSEAFPLRGGPSLKQPSALRKWDKKNRGRKREGEKTPEGGQEYWILFKCSCKPSKILMLQSYLWIFKNIKGR